MLNYTTFLATLQLVDEICTWANRLCDDDFEAMSWSDFVSGIKPEIKTELVTYLKSKSLYINESEDI